MSEEIKSRAWISMLYPESVRPDWKSWLNERGVQALISPLHDRDLEQDGLTLKKPHHHVLLIWDGPCTEKVARYWVNELKTVGCFRAQSMRGTARYHLHMDNPEKAQYSRADEMIFGGLDYDDIIHSTSEDSLILKDILRYIKNNKIYYFNDLLDDLMESNEDWWRTVINVYRENILAYQKSMFTKDDRAFRINQREACVNNEKYD